MKKLLYVALIGTSLAAFTSCSSDSEAEQDAVTNTNTPAPTPTTLPMPEQSATTPVADPATPAAAPQAAPATANAAPPPPAAAPSNGNVKLNPAHGQPGHDCAIAVGAPLNGKRAAAPTAPQAKPVMNVAPAAAPAKGGSGRVNPAHGQPGHDCAVAVGAPLPG